MISFLLKSFTFIFLLSSFKFLLAQSEWREAESEHFKVIYEESHSYLAPHILSSAENALDTLAEIFNYSPKQKIVINTYDVYDYGFGSATTVPQNYIRLEIEPLEPGYESAPYRDRIEWILSHELVHIVINDKGGNFQRCIFGKVYPEQEQPLTIPFSLATNPNRYTPRWHQEAIAVFMETWLNGGFGRLLSSFNEMYFRSMTAHKKHFPDFIELETITSKNSFLVETLFYLYGARFTAYLSIKYGADKLIEWFGSGQCPVFGSFKQKFENIFGITLEEGWGDFISFEKKFQKSNLEKLRNSNLTQIEKLSGPAGWVSEPHVDKNGKSVFFAYHHPHQLAAIQKFNLVNGSSENIGTLTAPSILQVSSTAYDKILNLFFYTTNNNQLFRDIWALNTITKKEELLFEDSRIGDLTISAVTHDLWGVIHSAGKTALAYSPYPYKNIFPLIAFNYGDEIFDISISPSGSHLSAILHRSSGEQLLVIANADSIKNGDEFEHETIYSKGSPENPSWSNDGKFIYWNAYTNGVSNIFRFSVEDKNIEPVSNTLIGLFKPVYLNKDSLFAFEFSVEGFIPVIIPNKKAEFLPAIEYLGQRVLNKNPELSSWNLKQTKNFENNIPKSKPYNGFKNLELNTIIPVVSGFQNEVVFGLYARLSDPMVIHDITAEFGISSFTKSNAPEYHFKLKYNYNKRWEFQYNYNAQDFYDLFNTRKRGMAGAKISLGNTHYWVYDNPLKVKQESEIAYYRGVESIKDNLVQVSEPDFFTIQTNFNSENLRRSIGSTDYENGNEFNASLLAFGAQPNDPELALQVFGAWDNYSTFVFPHNVFHLKVAAGYHFDNDKLRQSQFFFGGFGNREVEDANPDQFRDIFRFPGIPIYSLNTSKFLKLMFELDLPPVRFDFINLGGHMLEFMDVSLYSQGLLIESPQSSDFANAGAQVNFVFKHWFNLESTLSAGIANAWSNAGSSWEWFISFKILKD